ncbi:MAG TPA: tRNA uridine-5-carboxymethylaminomethyl(34) synthesis enzyme MnmG, partial [Paludibacteraceae bacterium]|nr:tRNA uridine-5-carboxymethylaminomethyl(34) synthesis enzyme MnmG [Paludibacteraceae bacterium]
INAHLKINGKDKFILNRDEAYIGVLIDDLVTKGVDEPYRMFTSRAEYRILLRQDDADKRLTEKSYRIGLATQERYNLMKTKYAAVDDLINYIKSYSVKMKKINPYLESQNLVPLKQSVKLYDLILRPQLNISILKTVLPDLAETLSQIEQNRREEIIEAAEIQIKYSGYIEREKAIADKLHRLENIRIGNKFNYEQILSLSTEAREKLTKIQPETIGQASRIPGVSPNDINVLLVLLGR